VYFVGRGRYVEVSTYCTPHFVPAGDGMDWDGELEADSRCFGRWNDYGY
jgi:hypothetical protein